MSIISLHGVTLHVGGNLILDNVDWQIEPQQRIALVGRNGAGKSSLLRLLQGQLVPDFGVINRLGGIRVAGLTQEVPISADEAVYHFLVKSLGHAGEVLAKFHQLSQDDDLQALADCQVEMDNLQLWDHLVRVEMLASRLGILPNDRMDSLSGGMKRRVLLAAALIANPDLLLLDEPTNHLDVNTIEWLESWLKTYHGSVLVVTHDRTFLNQVATQIVDIDRGKLSFFACDYETYLDRREIMRETEQKHNQLFDKRLAEEEVWIRTGIKARRTRNEGRVRALKALREVHKARRQQIGKVQSLAMDVAQTGNLVIEAKQLNLTLGKKVLLQDFSLLLTKGDKVGIIGSNGCGKTSLIRVLLGELQANSGKIRRSNNLKVAYFDQLRRQLDENQTVMANVADGAEHVVVNGKQKHVATYLREFLFSPERFNQLVSTLSGGERNRLLLAKLLVKPVNLLVMDEPTNDLDIETLEVLETMLVDYPGTLLLISHDREFINQVVTSILVYEREGIFTEYVGGYDDYKNQKKQQKDLTNIASKPVKQTVNSGKLTFNEQRELAQLPQQIERLEQVIVQVQLTMSAPEFYQQDAQTITDINQQLVVKERELSALYQRWEQLEEKG